MNTSLNINIFFIFIPICNLAVKLNYYIFVTNNKSNHNHKKRDCSHILTLVVIGSQTFTFIDLDKSEYPRHVHIHDIAQKRVYCS